MRPETKALLDKAGQSIQAATNLRRDGFLDFAASRAYYAMFYIAQALIDLFTHSMKTGAPLGAHI